MVPQGLACTLSQEDRTGLAGQGHLVQGEASSLLSQPRVTRREGDSVQNSTFQLTHHCGITEWTKSDQGDICPLGTGADAHPIPACMPSSLPSTLCPERSQGFTGQISQTLHPSAECGHSQGWMGASVTPVIPASRSEWDSGGLPCGPVVRTWCFHYRGHGFDLWSGNQVTTCHNATRNKYINKHGVACNLEKAMATHSSTLAWRIPWMEEPGRLQFMGSLRVRHDWATSLSLFNFLHWRSQWQPTPSILAWRIPWTEEPGGLLSMGSHRVGHDWSDLAAAACNLFFREKSEWVSEWWSSREHPGGDLHTDNQVPARPCQGRELPWPLHTLPHRLP